MLYQNGYSQGYAFVFMDARLAVFDLLEDRHAIKILVLLLRRGKMNKTEMYSELSKGSVIVAKRLDALAAAGLVTETIFPSKPFPHFIELTECGRTVAGQLDDVGTTIERCISEVSHPSP